MALADDDCQPGPELDPRGGEPQACLPALVNGDLLALAKGDRVMVVKLQGRSEMNGWTGTLICKREDRWHVKLDENR
eukprot:CAMPEP_0175597808 /NCGR_PEP_ID=MMETSP0096-20121207/56228_1 /TAXON_ID=311494 /ORGANISM="Alexandrium monilatum, Strain CCMP3105" /LENGTH=76 /DNA_ID=CAMNT_0016902293 /DNA_START=1 /DNA_END=227 /DNA_ORIENTATION=+